MNKSMWENDVLGDEGDFLWEFKYGMCLRYGLVF